MKAIKIVDTSKKIKINVPVTFETDASLGGNLWLAHDQNNNKIVCQRILSSNKNEFLAVVSFDKGDIVLTFDHELTPDNVEGIQELENTQEEDAYVHLNTGVFDLELCRGTARGEGASKWGLRHFKTLEENKDLLPSGNNAMGGFYGPFFTPDNGLINPAEHLIVEIETVENGPIFKQYRLSGRIPDGIKSELHGKRFSVDWSFYHNVPFFSRVYHVDHFVTTVNKRSISDKITVGDEFESGIGQQVFDRFGVSSGVWYREGDPYASDLSDKVNVLVNDENKRGERFENFRSLLTGDMASAHWDLYWRLFSVWENALNKEEIDESLKEVRSKAFVEAESNDRPWKYSKEAVDVSRVADQTIFAGPAKKSVEFNSKTHQAMIWQTDKASGAFQIVQRPNSGWQNWGTNGENECPALPTGTLIHTAYGPYEESWKNVADSLEAITDIKALEV